MARNVERWVDLIVLRTYAHETITEMAAVCTRAGDQCAQRSGASLPGPGRLHDARRALRHLAGCNFTYVGDGNNVCHSLMLTAALLGANCIVATPERLLRRRRRSSTKARDIADDIGATVTLTQDPHRPRDGGRRDLHRRLHQHGLRARSHQARTDLQALPGERSTDGGRRASTLSSCTACLRTAMPRSPTQVLDGPQSIVFDQAENRMHAQKAILLMLLGAAEPERRKSKRNNAGSCLQ